MCISCLPFAATRNPSAKTVHRLHGNTIASCQSRSATKNTYSITGCRIRISQTRSRTTTSGICGRSLELMTSSRTASRHKAAHCRRRKQRVRVFGTDVGKTAPRDQTLSGPPSTRGKPQGLVQPWICVRRYRVIGTAPNAEIATHRNLHICLVFSDVKYRCAWKIWLHRQALYILTAV